MKAIFVGAAEFKAKCLALLDEVDDERNTITVTQRGKPIAMIVPASKPALKSPKGILAGKVKIVGDIVNTDSSALWEVPATG